jgi:hypothetical protein
MKAILPVFGSEYEGFEDGPDEEDDPRAGWPNTACVICGETVTFEGDIWCADCEFAVTSQDAPNPPLAPLEPLSRDFSEVPF